jgi:hypothetical protein
MSARRCANPFAPAARVVAALAREITPTLGVKAEAPRAKR